MTTGGTSYYGKILAIVYLNSVDDFLYGVFLYFSCVCEYDNLPD